MSKQWDVFISYAREESLTANRLYEKLLGCSTSDGRRPLVFLDTSRDGVAPGDKWTSTLAEALLVSRCFIPLYSPLYLTIHNVRVHDHSLTADGVEANMAAVWLDA